MSELFFIYLFFSLFVVFSFSSPSSLPPPLPSLFFLFWRMNSLISNFKEMTQALNIISYIPIFLVCTFYPQIENMEKTYNFFSLIL